MLKQLFFEGGAHFMGMLTLLLIAMVAWTCYYFVVAFRTNESGQNDALRKMGYGKMIGLFALMVGLTGQMIGLTAMFDAIQQAAAAGETIKTGLVAGGIKVTMFVTIYGIIIFSLSLLLRFLFTLLIDMKRLNKA